jgi:hypothetical protein
MCYFFARFWQSNVGWAAYSALMLTVWLIYTLDHLIDAIRIPHQAHTARHRFHQQYFKTLVIISFLVLMIDIVCVSYLNPVIFYQGFIVSLLVAGHLLFGFFEAIKKWRFFQKEGRIAFIYTLGVSFAPFSIAEHWEFTQSFPIRLQVFLIAFVNLLLISYFEADSDQADRQASLALQIGKQQLKYLIISLIIFQFLAAFILIFIVLYTKPLFSVIPSLMMLCLALTFISRHFTQHFERYRALSDAVFFFPFLLIFA